MEAKEGSEFSRVEDSPEGLKAGNDLRVGAHAELGNVVCNVTAALDMFVKVRRVS